MAWVELSRGVSNGFIPLRYKEIAFFEDSEIEPAPKVSHCARCKREIKPQYKVCYRCYHYLKKTAGRDVA